jgi:hypothetical protein
VNSEEVSIVLFRSGHQGQCSGSCKRSGRSLSGSCSRLIL